MTRSNAREIAVHLIYAARSSEMPIDELFASRFEEAYYTCLGEENEVYKEKPGNKQLGYIRRTVEGVFAHLEELDGYISKYSIGWNLNRISRLARAMMELAIYETLYVEDVPTGVAIHEAVLLARKYEEDDTVAFVNGVLGSFARSLDAASTQQEQKETEV